MTGKKGINSLVEHRGKHRPQEKGAQIVRRKYRK
jgi:hypothetical protein